MHSKIAIFLEVTITVRYNLCKFHVVYKEIPHLFNILYADEGITITKHRCKQRHRIGEVLPIYFMISLKQALQNIQPK